VDGLGREFRNDDERGSTLWKERNRRVHDLSVLQPVALAQEILKEAKSVFVWAMDFEEVVVVVTFRKAAVECGM
jgi:hypothetical protein